MVDPMFAAAATAVLTQGVTFLYDQAGRLLSRRRELRAVEQTEGSSASTTTSASQLPLLSLPPDGVFAVMPPAPVPAVPDVLEANAEALRQARRAVEDVVLGDRADFSVPGLLQAVEDLRSLLEQVYGTDLTFAQERREPSSASSAHSVGTAGVYFAGPVHTTGDIAGRDVVKR